MKEYIHENISFYVLFANNVNAHIAFARVVTIGRFKLICPHMTDIYSALQCDITIQPYLQPFFKEFCRLQ